MDDSIRLSSLIEQWFHEVNTNDNLTYEPESTDTFAVIRYRGIMIAVVKTEDIMLFNSPYMAEPNDILCHLGPHDPDFFKKLGGYLEWLASDPSTLANLWA